MASILVLLVLVVIAVFGYETYAVYWAASEFNYGIGDMDWNQDGRVSVREFFRSADVGARSSHRDPECREYFDLKDGYTVLKEVCPGPSR